MALAALGEPSNGGATSSGGAVKKVSSVVTAAAPSASAALAVGASEPQGPSVRARPQTAEPPVAPLLETRLQDDVRPVVAEFDAAQQAQLRGDAQATRPQPPSSSLDLDPPYPHGGPLAIEGAQAQVEGGAQQGQGPLRADDAWEAFEARLEADLQTVGVTLVAILGVIIFWRGVWSLLDYYLGDNPIGDVCCVLVGLGIILYIRLSGLKVGTFWPSG